jgi:DNA-binding XRE family transcriptional regulator
MEPAAGTRAASTAGPAAQIQLRMLQHVSGECYVNRTVSNLTICSAMTKRPRYKISTGDLSLPRKPSFARHLREARIRRGLSVSDVAEQVGVSTASIYFWETDHCRPRNANLTALCKALKLPIRATREMATA